MQLVCRLILTSAIALGVAMSAVAQTPQTPAKEQPPAQPPPPAQQPPAPEEPPKYEEIVVISGSRVEEKLINTPATMSVITSQMIETAPTQNFAELLRSVPGLNITQVSARDINVTSRAPTGTLATGQLALLDGRSLYQDFFGFVMWDFLPVNLNEIKQIEVIRGPASAVWGANALYGVVNVITKSPREMPGTSVTFGTRRVRPLDGRRRRRQRQSLVYVSGTHAQVDQRSMVVQGVWQAATRRMRCRGRPGRFQVRAGRSTQPTSTPARHSRNSMDVLITTLLTAASCRFLADSPAPKGSCTRASARSTSTAARSWATDACITREKGFAAHSSRTFSTGRPRTC